MMKSCFRQQWVTAVLLLQIFIAIPFDILAFSVTTTSQRKQGRSLRDFYFKSYVLHTNDGYISSIKNPSSKQSTTKKLHSTTDDNLNITNDATERTSNEYNLSPQQLNNEYLSKIKEDDGKLEAFLSYIALEIENKIKENDIHEAIRLGKL
jgi:CRISPR/Cas system-associated protein endoribonuclease Cas2